MTPSSLSDSQNNENSAAKAALIGLAVSVSATGMLLVGQEEQAIAAEPTGSDYTMTTPDSSTSLGRKPLQMEDVRKQAIQGIPAPRLLVEPTQLRKTDQHLPVNSFGNIPSKINRQQLPRPIAEKDSQDSTIKDHLPVTPKLRVEPTQEKKVDQPRTSLLLPLPAIDYSITPKASLQKSAPNVTVHQVKYGDTLGEIATAYNVPVTALVQANNLINPNLIEVNQLLLVPKTTATQALANPPKTAKELSWKPVKIKASEITAVAQDNLVTPLPQKQQPILITENAPTVNDNSSDSSNPHVEKLRADIVRLQEEYKDDFNSNSTGQPITIEQLRASQKTQAPGIEPTEITVAAQNNQVEAILQPEKPKLIVEKAQYQPDNVPHSSNPYLEKLRAEVKETQQDKDNVNRTSTGELITIEQLRASNRRQVEEKQPKVIQPALVYTSVVPQLPTSPTKNLIKDSQPQLPQRLNIAQLNDNTSNNAVNTNVEKLQSDIDEIRQQYRNQRNLKRLAQPSGNSPAVKPESLKPLVPPTAEEPSKEPINSNLGNSPSSTQTFSSEDPTNTTPSGRDRLIGAAPGNIENYNPNLNVPPKNNPLEPLPEEKPSRFEGYMWPAKGVFTSGYGWRWGRFHHGVDVANSVGTPVVASASGEVIFAGWNNGGFGNLVKIRHSNGSITLYAHNSRVLVYEGQRVAKGEQIAAMGSTGLSTGPHVHFEVHPDGLGAVNPIAFLPKNL